jgi:hypothetical protein
VLVDGIPVKGQHGNAGASGSGGNGAQPSIGLGRDPSHADPRSGVIARQSKFGRDRQLGAVAPGTGQCALENAEVAVQFTGQRCQMQQ